MVGQERRPSREHTCCPSSHVRDPLMRREAEATRAAAMRQHNLLLKADCEAQVHAAEVERQRRAAKKAQEESALLEAAKWVVGGRRP